MHFVLSALLLCSFMALLLAGLAGVLRDMLARNFGPLIARALGAIGVPRSRFGVRSRSPDAAEG